MIWRSYPDDHEKPKIRHYMEILDEVVREFVPVGQGVSKEVGEIIHARWEENHKPLRDWLLERNRCLNCEGHAIDWFGFDCDDCLGSGKQEDAERISKLMSFQ